MSHKNEFLQDSLSDAYTRIESTLQTRKQLLDKLSNDILLLENLLKENACPQGVSFDYKNELKCDVLKSISSYHFDEYFNRVSCGQVTEKNYRLFWGKNEGKTRLYHTVRSKIYDVFFRNGGHPAIGVWREQVIEQEDEPKPLIECSTDVRLDVSNQLPMFLSAIDNRLKNVVSSDFLADESQWLTVWRDEAKIWHPLSLCEEVP